MAATHLIVVAFITGLVSAQLPFHNVPAYGIGGIGFGHLGGAGAFTHGFGHLGGAGAFTHGFGHLGGAGAFTHGFGQPGVAGSFTHGFGPFPRRFLPYYGMTHPMSLPTPVGGAVGTTHTVSHTSAAAVPHPVGPHVRTTSKAVTVGHHLPTMHVTTVHHPATGVATHMQHVNYGPGFPGAVPYFPYPYGPGLPHFGPQYPTSVFGHQTPVVTHSSIVKTTSQTSDSANKQKSDSYQALLNSYLELVKKLSFANVEQPSNIYSYQNYKPVASVMTKTHHFPAGYPYGLPGVAATSHHQTVSHMNPGFGFAHFPAAFPGTLPARMTRYQQTTAYPGIGYGYGFPPGPFNPAFGAYGTPFPYMNAGLHGGAVSSSAVHTVHPHPGFATPSLYPGALPGYPFGTYNPFGYYPMFGSSTTDGKNTKTSSQKSGSSNKN